MMHMEMFKTKPNRFHLHTLITSEDEESAGRVDRGDDGNARQVQDEDQAGGPRYSQYPFQVPFFKPISFQDIINVLFKRTSVFQTTFNPPFHCEATWTRNAMEDK